MEKLKFKFAKYKNISIMESANKNYSRRRKINEKAWVSMKRYDPSKGKYTSYIYNDIKGVIYTVYNTCILHLSNYYAGLWYKLKKAYEVLKQEGEEVTIESLHSFTGISMVSIRNTIKQKPVYDLFIYA